jgi:hypothetical protein
MKPTLKAPGTKCLTLKCGDLLSTFAFTFSLRRYTEVAREVALGAPVNFGGFGGEDGNKVGRCSFTNSR